MQIKNISTLFLLLAPLIAQKQIWPTDAGNSYSSNFGEYRDDHFHMGLDIRTKGTVGHKVFAVENGYISRIVTNYSGYGKAIYQKTTSGKTIVYAHLDKFSPIMERVLKLQQSKNKKYTRIENIKREVDEAKKTFQKYRWPSIDITRKSVEETAASIIKIHEIYLNNVK